MVFGRNFEDNLHIQLAYAILDMDKILAVQVNNVVYALNNMLRKEGISQETDLLGNIGIGMDYQKFMNPKSSFSGRSLISAQQKRELFKELFDKTQLEYFGTILRDEDSVKAATKGIKSNEERQAEVDRLFEAQREQAYYKLCLIGMMRQATAHGNVRTMTSMYTLEAAFDKENADSTARMQAKSILDSIY